MKDLDSPLSARRNLSGRTGVVLVAVLAGAVGSLVCTLYAGRHNDSRLLMALFGLWVLSPFVALTWINFAAGRWASMTRATLHSVTLFLVVGSLAVYGFVAFGPPRAKSAPAFVVIPPASWLLLATSVPLAALIAGKGRRG